QPFRPGAADTPAPGCVPTPGASLRRYRTPSSTPRPRCDRSLDTLRRRAWNTRPRTGCRWPQNGHRTKKGLARSCSLLEHLRLVSGFPAELGLGTTEVAIGGRFRV